MNTALRLSWEFDDEFLFQSLQLSCVNLLWERLSSSVRGEGSVLYFRHFIYGTLSADMSYLQADYMTVLEKEMDYKEEKFDFLQIQLRNWCLKCEL